MGKFMRDQALLAVPVEEVRTEDRHGLGLDGNLQVVVGDHYGVLGERKGTEQLFEHDLRI